MSLIFVIVFGLGLRNICSKGMHNQSLDAVCVTALPCNISVATRVTFTTILVQLNLVISPLSVSVWWEAKVAT